MFLFDILHTDNILMIDFHYLMQLQNQKKKKILKHFIIEEVVRYSMKKLFWNISQYSHENVYHSVTEKEGIQRKRFQNLLLPYIMENANTIWTHINRIFKSIPLKTSEKVWFTDVFRGVKKWNFEKKYMVPVIICPLRWLEWLI